MKPVKYLFVILFLILAIPISAQTLGGSVMLGLPQGEFKDNVDRAGYGFQVQGTLWSPGIERPFTVGANIGYLIYGEETESRPFSITNPDVTVDVTRRNSLVNFHFLAQLSPFTGIVRPYIEGLFGGAYIFTMTEIESQFSNDNIASTNNFDDFTWSYGGGGGLLIKLTGEMDELSVLYLDLKCRYVLGTEAQYLTEGDVVINRNNSTVTYYPRKSKTDLITIHVGVVAYF